ncbi:hypothetical protein [Rhodovulum bhavnagarense]|nr:hypothetical protein [Rhodovulum bhavnagarense]
MRLGPSTADARSSVDPITLLPAYPSRMYTLPFDTSLPVLVVSKKDTGLAQAVGWMRAGGFSVGRADGIEQALSTLRTGAGSWGGAMVNVDDFGGMEILAGALCELRLRIPGLPIILITRDADQDDFGPSRLGLADVTLRAPLTITALEAGLAFAAENNLRWQRSLATRT